MLRTVDVEKVKCFSSRSGHHVYMVNYGDRPCDKENPLRAVSEGCARFDSVVVDIDHLYYGLIDPNRSCVGFLVPDQLSESDVWEATCVTLAPDFCEIARAHWDVIAGSHMFS